MHIARSPVAVMQFAPLGSLMASHTYTHTPDHGALCTSPSHTHTHLAVLLPTSVSASPTPDTHMDLTHRTHTNTHLTVVLPAPVSHRLQDLVRLVDDQVRSLEHAEQEKLTSRTRVSARVLNAINCVRHAGNNTRISVWFGRRGSFVGVGVCVCVCVCVCKRKSD